MSQGAYGHGSSQVQLNRIDKHVWEIPKGSQPGMRVPGRIYADDALIEKMRSDATLQQCANVATLPGLYNWSITMPDGHEGYGFPIGGVAASDYDEGVVSPGGIGYDINCGVRLIRTNLAETEVRPLLPKLLDTMFTNVPSGLGSKGKVGRLSQGDLEKVTREGVEWAVDHGYGWSEDQKHCEENGCMAIADPDKVS